MIVDGLNEMRFVVVVDDFEAALEVETLRVADPGLAAFFDRLTEHLRQGSRVIVTSRYMPADISFRRPAFLHLQLPEFGASEFNKFLRRDPVVNRRIRRNQLPPPILAALHRVVGGTPGFAEHVRTLLRAVDPDELAEELAGIEAGPVSELQKQYNHKKVVVARLYDALPPEVRSLSSRVAVSELPLSSEVVSRITGLGIAQTTQSLEVIRRPCCVPGWPIRKDSRTPSSAKFTTNLRGIGTRNWRQ
jgi:hypothetical protein